MTESDLDRIYAALASEIQRLFGITAAGGIFRAAGLLPSGKQFWAPFMAVLEAQFRDFPFDGKLRTVRLLAERLMKEERPEVWESVKTLLQGHGFQFIDNTFVPTSLFDEREAHFLPELSVSELSTAFTRLVTDDLDGAMTSACSAVEAAASEVYKQKGLGNYASEQSFQTKTIKAIDGFGKLSALESQLIDLGWAKQDAEILVQNLRRSFNHAAYVMQKTLSEIMI